MFRNFEKSLEVQSKPLAMRVQAIVSRNSAYTLTLW